MPVGQDRDDHRQHGRREQRQGHQLMPAPAFRHEARDENRDRQRAAVLTDTESTLTAGLTPKAFVNSGSSGCTQYSNVAYPANSNTSDACQYARVPRSRNGASVWFGFSSSRSGRCGSGDAFTNEVSAENWKTDNDTPNLLKLGFCLIASRNRPCALNAEVRAGHISRAQARHNAGTNSHHSDSLLAALSGGDAPPFAGLNASSMRSPAC